MSILLRNVSHGPKYPQVAPDALIKCSILAGKLRQRFCCRARGIMQVGVMNACVLATICGSITSVYGQSDPGYDEEMAMGSEDPDGYGYDGSSSSYGGGSSSYGGSNQGGSMRRGVSSEDYYANGFAAALNSALTATGLETLADPEAAPPVLAGPVLLNDATVAYAKGNYALAMRLYFGHIVAEYDAAESQLQLAKYSGLMKRPAWQIRWGISYSVRGDSTDPQPIGDIAGSSRGAAGRSTDGTEMGMDDYGYEDGASGMESRGPRGAQARGNRGPSRGPGSGMGTEEMDMQDMAYEQEMQDMQDMYYDDTMGMGGPGAGRRRNAAPVGPPTPAARLAALELPMLSEDADRGLVDNLGVVATILGEEFDKRYSQGSFGRAMTDITPESGSVDTVSEALVDLLETTENTLPLWRPGIVFVGEGLSADTTKTAQKADLDLLLHIDVLLKSLGTGEYTQNISRCRLIHVPSGKSLGISKTIDSLEFAKTSRGKSLASRDYVGDQLANFLDIIDKQTVTAELPALTKEIALKRIGDLLGSGGGANLRTLAEVRLFQAQRLFDEDDVIAAFDIVGGEEALQMIYGSEEERLRIARKWAGGKAGASE